MSRRSDVVLAALFALLTALVVTGVFTGTDQWAVDHLMPGADFSPNSTTLTDGLIPLRHVRWSSGWQVAVNIVTLPASFFIALALIAWRSRRLALALLACVAVEVICKSVFDRPALFDGRLHISGFDSSFPSGHTLRTVLLTIAFVPLLGRAAIAWAAASLALILLAGWHTPTDMVGGILLGLLGGRAAGALGARGLRAPTGARGRPRP